MTATPKRDLKLWDEMTDGQQRLARACTLGEPLTDDDLRNALWEQTDDGRWVRFPVSASCVARFKYPVSK